MARLDFVTTVGHGDGPGARERLGLRGRGPTAVITDLGVLEPDPDSAELTLTQLHEGVSVDQAREATGWELAVGRAAGRDRAAERRRARGAEGAARTMNDAFIYEAVRTPFGRFGGALAGVRPDDLAAHALRSLLERAGLQDAAAIDDVIIGNANGAGEDNRDVARMAVLLAGLPTTVTGVSVNRLCGSSLEAAIQAARAVRCGDASLIVAGGVESMSRAPWVLLKPSRAYPARDTRRSTRPRSAGAWSTRRCPSGGPSRSVRAPRSWPRSTGSRARPRMRSRSAATGSPQQAYDDGVMAEVVAVPGVELTRDEGIRTDTTLEALAKLEPAFVDGGTVTAGNSSPLNDGASMTLIGDRRPASCSAASRSPGSSRWRLTASTPTCSASPRSRRPRPRCARAGLGWGEVAVVELNEAFASQSLACLAGWPELDPALVNVRGGAIAIGHPLGASGTRILGRLAHELHSRGGGYGLAAICIGVGQGLAMILEG